MRTNWALISLKRMKKQPEYVEGSEAWGRFRAGMAKVLTVSHEEIKRRIEREREHAAKNPRRRGPKRKG